MCFCAWSKILPLSTFHTANAARRSSLAAPLAPPAPLSWPAPLAPPAPLASASAACLGERQRSTLAFLACRRSLAAGRMQLAALKGCINFSEVCFKKAIIDTVNAHTQTWFHTYWSCFDWAECHFLMFNFFILPQFYWFYWYLDFFQFWEMVVVTV